MQRTHVLSILKLAPMLMLACDSNTSSGDTDGSADEAQVDTNGAGSNDTNVAASSESGDGPGMCGGGGGANADGESCTKNEDCASGVCALFADAPVDPEATCRAAPASCAVTITGTLREFSPARTPLPNVEVRFAPALDAITDPINSRTILTQTSDANGRIDAITDGPLDDVEAAIALVALAGAGDGYFLTASGVASPGDVMTGNNTWYNVGIGIHEYWAVPQTLLDAWSETLALDDDVRSEWLPLGEKGGVVGLVRDKDGNPLAGVTVRSGDRNNAVVRYLANEDTNTFGSDLTGTSGLFVLFDVAIDEPFIAERNGQRVGKGNVGQANGVVFTLVIDET